jgi:hypothetical protein
MTTRHGTITAAVVQGVKGCFASRFVMLMTVNASTTKFGLAETRYSKLKRSLQRSNGYQ